MIDCYMSLTLPYAIELARRCEPYNVKWIEEALVPDDYEGYADLKKAVKTTLITTGEHEYTREFFNCFTCIQSHIMIFIYDFILPKQFALQDMASGHC